MKAIFWCANDIRQFGENATQLLTDRSGASNCRS